MVILGGRFVSGAASHLKGLRVQIDQPDDSFEFFSNFFLN